MGGVDEQGNRLKMAQSVAFNDSGYRKDSDVATEKQSDIYSGKNNGDPVNSSITAGGAEPLLLRALAGADLERPPVWFMRQAGRSLPEYRALREQSGLDMLDACLDPEFVAEATLQPVRRHGVDAAILFSDIMCPLRLAGVGVEIEPGVGPVLRHPVRNRVAVERLFSDHPDLRVRPGGLETLTRTVGDVVTALGTPGGGSWTPLIGFGGAPFTLAAYMVEGRPSRDHLAARVLMHGDPVAWGRLMTWCASITGDFIAAQVSAGASVVQLFDSWVGGVSVDDYGKHILTYSSMVVSKVSGVVSPTTGRRAPLIHFGLVESDLLPALQEAGGDAFGIDHRLPLDAASDVLGGESAVQGNIDPSFLFAPREVLDAHVADIIDRGRSAPGHILNLGHGVPPDADPDVLTHIVRLTHEG